MIEKAHPGPDTLKFPEFAAPFDPAISAERRYRDLFNSMNEGVAIHRLVYSQSVPTNYLLLDVNHRFEEILSISRGAAVNRLATEVYGTEHAPFLREFASVVESGVPFQFEAYFAPLARHFALSVSPMGNDQFSTTFVDVTEQKNTEERYRLISENAADVIWVWDLAGDKCIYVSPSVLKLRGFSPEEVLAQSMEELMSPASFQFAALEIRRRVAALDSGDQNARIGSTEIEFRRKDGTVVATESVTTLQTDDSGAVRYVIGVSRDITERKRMEAILRKSEEKFAAAFLLSPSATCIVDPSEGIRIIDVNESWGQTYGYQRFEAVGRTEVELGIIDAATAEERRRRFAADGGLRNFEYQFRHKSGRQGTGMVSATPIEIAGKLCALEAIVDITERKLAEEALRRSEDKFSKLFHSSPVAKAIIDLQGPRIVDVNDAFERITGYRRDEVVGHDEFKLWADPEERVEAFRQVRAHGCVHNFENRFCRKNGDIGVGIISIDTLQIEGRPHAVVANLEITEQKLAQAQQAKLEERLRQAQKLESVGRLAGGIAHDFNNLLTVINGYAEMVASAMDPANPSLEEVEEIRKAGERAAGLTRQLLAFSRKQIIEPKRLDLNSLVRDSERMLRRLIGEDIEFSTTLEPNLGRVMADPEQIHQVIMNLAVNARDAMPDGGKLDLLTSSVEFAENDLVLPADAKPGPYVVLTVSDTGSGMDEATRLQIFEPFFTTKSRDRGTGLGLSTVYGIVRQSGGWITVRSEIGAGTSFIVGFPRLEGLPELDTSTPPAVHTGRRGETILLVEDQDALRRLAKAILLESGYCVLEAADGMAAIEAAKQHSGEIHLLLTDVVLPGINGKELSERLKEVLPELKVLFTSGYSADVIAHRGVLDSGVSYLPKPFTSVDLVARIREVLDDPSSD